MNKIKINWIYWLCFIVTSAAATLLIINDTELIRFISLMTIGGCLYGARYSGRKDNHDGTIYRL